MVFQARDIVPDPTVGTYAELRYIEYFSFKKSEIWTYDTHPLEPSGDI